MIKEPRRLIDEGPAALAASIAALRQRQPTGAQLAALAARLGGVPANENRPLATEHAAQPRSAPTLRVITGLRLLEPGTLAVIGALVVGALLVLGAVTLRGDDTPVRLEPVVVPAGSRTATGNVSLSAKAVATVPGSPSAVVDPLADPHHPTASLAPTTADVADAPVATSVGVGPAGPTPPPTVAPSARVRTAASDPAATVRAKSPTSGALPPTSASPAEVRVVSADAPLVENTVVASEVEMLKQARSVLAADPAQAYALTERCRAIYPSGAFAQEREYIAISALGRLGRANDAHSRASLFRMRYPSSAYLPRLARLVGDE